MKVSARRAFILVILCLVVYLPTTSSAQNTIHVPGDSPSIQSAIFAAQNNDTVLVAPGFYFEPSLNFQGKSITVMSSGGPSVTTVDSGSQPAALFTSNDSNGAVLGGFTFIHAQGIQIGLASPIIENNVISNNEVCQAGGITASSSNAIIRGNTITNNRQVCAEPASAGGIVITGFGNVQVLKQHHQWKPDRAGSSGRWYLHRCSGHDDNFRQQNSE